MAAAKIPTPLTRSIRTIIPAMLPLGNKPFSGEHNSHFLYSSACFSYSKNPHLSSPPMNNLNQINTLNTTTAATSNPPPPALTKTVRVMIKGRVQGVFFRDWTVENATELGLNGWVRNRRDGSVEALFSGDPNSVHEMEQRCRRGPPHALVTGFQVFPSDEDPGQGFDRKPTA